MFLRNCGFNNVGDYDDGTFEFGLCISGMLGMRTARRQQLRNRATALQDYDSLRGRLHTIENRQAPSFEVGRVDALHTISIEA